MFMLTVHVHLHVHDNVIAIYQKNLFFQQSIVAINALGGKRSFLINLRNKTKTKREYSCYEERTLAITG